MSRADETPVDSRPQGLNRFRGVPALAIAVVALFAIVATIVGIGQRTRALREEVIQVLEPARNQLYEIQRLLALQEAEQRGGAPSGALQGTLPDLTGASSEVQVAIAQLRTLSRRAGPETLEAFAGFRSDVERWLATLEEANAAPESPQLRAFAEAEYARVLDSAARMHSVLNQETALVRDRTQSLERLERALIGGMVFLALIATLGLGRISRQQAELVERSRRLAEESEKRRREIERIVEQKAQFVRGITHDLKNPLGAVDAYAQLLDAELKGPLTDEQRRYVERIRHAVQLMLGTIQDLLELARIEADGIRIERQSFELEPLVGEVVEDHRAAIEAADLRLEVELREAPVRVSAEPRRVHEILGNLLSNAAKYTPPGGSVHVSSATRRDAAGRGEFALIEVRDTGIGIPAEQQERIFEEFQRLDPQAASGSGVGLAISRRIARMMGGDLTVESEPGLGSTFALWIPLATPAANVEQTPAE